MFDDPNLLAHAGLAPLLALAGRAGLPGLLAGARPAGPCGANAAAKAMCLVAGMAAGADSIDGMDLLRGGAMETVFGGVRAPSALATSTATSPSPVTSLNTWRLWQAAPLASGIWKGLRQRCWTAYLTTSHTQTWPILISLAST